MQADFEQPSKRLMTANETAQGVPDGAALARLLQVGVVIEEYAEEKSARLLADSVDDDVRDTLLESLEESTEHRDRLVELVSRVGADVDPETVEERVRDAVEASVEEPADEVEALERQLESELMAYEFYDDVLTAIDDSDFGCMDRDTVDEVTSTLSEIRDDELEDAREIEGRLTR